MTETSYHYGAKQPLPVASPPTYLLLIDSRVSNYQDIINAKQPGVYHIVFEAPTRPTRSTKLIKDIEEKIAALGVGAFTSIGLVQHNDEKPVYEMFGRTSDIIKPRIRAVERDDPYFQSWNSVALFITMLRNNYGIEYFDMMACALYSNPDWKYIIDKLTTLTGVAVRASTDDTGAASLGGDWFLESHTGVNLKSTYFTDAIESYNGLLYTAPPPPPTASTKKLILIDHRIKDIDVIINAMNDDTYCLVFNYFYDTPASILSKLRFLNSDNRYILDHFHYETPEIPTQIDASGNQCTPCDDFDIADIQLLPGTLQNEYLEYTTSAAAAANDASGNGGVWPFYSESTNITINKPVFFQRSKIGETTESVVYPSTEVSTVILNYKPRPMVLVSDLDEFYLLGQDVGEIVGDALAFECVGIIQHTVDPYIGYKFIGGGDDSVSPAIIQDVASRDASLSTWAAFAGVIQSLKTVHQTTTLDMMACALYANPDWKYIIDNLAVRENITIRASLDNTGSALDEGNWVLETDNVSLTTVYFTDKIYAWKYVLATYIDTRFNALRWNNPIETDNHTGMHASRAYDSRLKIAAGTNNFTIEAWYYETAARTNSTIVDMGNYNYLFQIRTIFSVNPVGGLNFYNNALGWRHASSATITPGQWNHVAITRSGSTFTFYVNGVAQQTFTSSVSFQSNDSTFAIGMQSPDTCACNKMKLDSVLYDIRLWSVARTATEIQMNRNRVVPANSTGLVANYLCTDNGSIFDDRTANNLDATIQSYDASRWSNSTVPIPNIGFLINNNYSLRTSNTGTALNAFTHFDNITYTDFSGVDLSGVNFRGADLTGCNFTNANLTNTNLTNAYLVNATTTNAITTGSTIAQAFTNLTSTVLNLDGVDDAVDLFVPTWTYSLQFRTTMTVECWFKTADTNNQKVTAVLVSRNQTGGNSGASQFSIYMLSTGEIGFGVTNASNSGSYHTTTQTYKDTLWHHAAFTYNSSSGVKRIYIDGSLSRSDSVPGGFGLLSNNTTQKLVIGSDDGGVVNGYTDRQFRGSMSDVRIWNVERSASQIADNYQQRLAGNETGLVGYWKLNQGRGSGWGSYSAVIDSTFRPNGTIFGAGATPSGSWVLSNLNFQPRVGTMTLGANNGVYNFSDSSFLFIDPSSNSLGNFSYSVSPTSVATITNGAATTKTIYSLSAANLVPTYTLYEFPVLADLASWQIDISFTVTSNTALGGSAWRALIGDMYNNVNTGRGWGLWVSSSNRIHWSWIGTTAEPGTISVSLNTPYVLTVSQNSGTIRLTLINMASTYNSSLSISNLVALYNFDSTINDSSVNNNHLTNINTVTFNTSDYKRGTAAAAFNGSNYFQINNDGRFSPDNISITFWIKPVSTPGNYQAIASCRNSTSTTDSGWIIYIGGSNLEFWSGAGPSWNNSGSLYDGFGDLNTWVHVSFTLNKSTSTLQLYINGSLFSSVSRTYINNTGTTLRIGAGRNEISAGFLLGNGTLLDDFRIYNKILSASEIGTMVAGSSYSSSFSIGANVIGRGPVTIGNFINTGSEYFPGTISYVNVSVPTNQRLVSFSSVTDAGTPATVTAIQDSSFDFGAGSQTASLTVSKANPTIGTLTAPAKNFGDASFNLTAPTSNSDGAFTYSSSNTAVATVTSGGTVTIVGAGSTTITASQAASADGNYNSGSVTASLVVSPINPTIGTLTAPAKNFGDASFNLTAPTSNSSGAFTYSSSNTGVATVTSGGTVTIVGAGSTTITASQAASADGNYNSGSVTASLVVSPINPTIGTLTAPAKNFGDASFNLTAPTSNSDGAFTYSSSNTAVATVTSGGTVTIVGAGSTTITASQAASADGNYNSGSVTASLVVSPINPTIGTLTAPAKNFGDASFNLTAPTSNSDGAFTYSSSNTAVATVTSGGTVTIVGAGSTTITASQAASADGNYNSGSVTASLVVSPIAPTIGTLTAPAKNFGDASFNLTAPTSNSDGAFTYSSSNTAVATVTSGGTVTIVGAGSTTITASQAASADGNYNSGSVTASLVVSPINPTIGTLTAPAKNFGDASFNLTAPTSNSSGAFTYSSSNTAVATVTSGGTVTIVGAGSTTITASQAASADGNYNSGSVTASLVVSPINPTIGTLTAPAKNFGDASFNLTAPTSNSSGAFTYTSSNTAVATVTSGGTVTIVGAGSTTITASQAASADGNYNSGSVTASLVVSPIAPTIGTLTAPAKNFGDASFNLTAPTSNSDGAFTYSSSNTAVATVTSGGTVTIVGAGSTTITATQAASADGNYNSGSVTASLVVSPIAPTIGSLSVSAKNFGDASFNLTAPTSNSGGAFTYSSSNTGVATVTSGGTVTIVGAGSTTITATQAASADGNYNSGSVTASLVVSPIAPTIGSLSVSAKNFGDASFNLTAPTSNSGGAFTYTSSNTAVATVTSGGIVIIVAAGSTTITASQAASADGNYNAGSVTAVLVVSPIAPTIGALSVPAKNFGDASFNLTAPTSDSSGAFTYSSSNTGVATVTSGGTVSIVGAGSTTITATQAASSDGNYTGGSTVSASLVVSPIAPTITSFSIPSKNFRDASFNLTAPSSNSSGAFTYDISNTAVATVTSGGVVTIVGAGTTNITATQAASADGNYTAGSSITAALVVSAVAPNIGALSVPAKNFGDASFNLTAPTSDSNGAFSYTSSNELVATVALVDGVGVITVVGAGSTTITATQAASADGNYTGGSSVSASLVVSPIAPTYQSISQITKTYSTDVSFSLLAVMSGVSNSDGAYSFSTASNAISIVNGIATILAYTPSAITITASQDASGNYTASTKEFTLLVSRKTPSYGEFSIPSKTFGDASFSIAPYAPTTDSTEVPFTYTSSDLNVATINSSGTDITIIGQGYTTITASQEASGNYAANSITTSFLVNRAAPTFLKAFTIPNKTFGDASFSLLPFTDGLDNTDGTYHFTSSNSELVSISAVDGVTATIHAYTPTPITIYVAIDACGNYAASSTSGTLTVLQAAPTIGALSVPATKNFGDASFNISAPSSNSSGAFTYTSSNTAVATVSDVGGVTTVSVVGAGSTTITATQATNGNYTSGSVSASIVVSPIAPTIGTLTAPAKNFGDASFNLTAPSSNSDGSFTYTSSNTAVATVSSDGTVSVVRAGSTTITATQAASSDGNYTGGSSVSASLVVSAIAPTIGSLSVPAKNFGDASFNLTAPTSDSSGAFSYTSSDTSVATVSNSGGVGTVTVVGAGTTTITATQAASADGNYTGGSSVSASLVVSPIAPTIGTLSVPAKNFGDASFNITAPSSNSSGAFTYTSSNTSVATVSNSGGVGTVTIVGAGSTTITATQAASSNGNYTGGSSVTASLVVSPIAPTIGSLSVPAKNFGDASFNLTAPLSNSAGAFTYTSSNPAVASVSIDGIVIIVSAGTTTITATQEAIVNGNYLTGSVTASLVVSAIAPTIGALSVPAKNFGDASFNLTAPSSNSDGAFTYTSSNTSVATVTSGGTVTVVGAGTTTMTATQAASSDGNYTGGSSVSASLVVSAIAPTIGTLSVPAKNFGDASFNLTAPSSNSGGAFTYTSSNTSVATVSLVGVVTVVGAGSTTITATQAASSDGNYTGGSSVSASLVVSPIASTIGSLSVPTKNFGDASFNLTAPTSNNIGAFTYTSSNPSVASVTTDGIVTIVAAGTTTITATQAATTNYNSGSVSASLVVSAIAPTIGALSVPAKNFGDASFNLTAPTSNSDGAFTYTSSNTAVATVALVGGVGVVTVVGAGSTTITATQAASSDGNYTGGSSVSASLVVSAIAPTIGSLSVPAKNFGDASFNLTAPSSNSGGAFTYTSSNTSVATVSLVGVVTVVGAGSTTITATQAASSDGNYTGGSSVSTSLVVSAIAPTIGTLSVPAKNFGDASFNLTAPTSNSNGAFTYSSSNTSVATVTSGGTVTVVGAGTTTITATQAATTNYNIGSVSASLVVSAIAPTIGTLSVPAKNFGESEFNITAPSSNSGGAFTYTSSNTAVATVSNVGGVGTVTIVSAGTTTITATQAATTNYTSGSVSASLVVSPIAPTIGALAVSDKNVSDPSFNLTAPTSNSSGAFTYSSSNTGVATVSNAGGVGTVSIVGVGTTTITATQAASSDGNYSGGSSVSATLTVSAELSNFTVPSNKKYGDASFDLTDPTSIYSGEPFTFSSSNPTVASIGGVDGRTVSIHLAGSTIITATQAATGAHGELSISATLIISKKTPVITVAAGSIAKNYGNASFNIALPSSTNTDAGGGGGAFSYSSRNTSIVSIIDTSYVSITGVGSTIIDVTQSATANFTEAVSTISITVSKGTPVLSAFTVAANKTYGSAPFSALAYPSSASAGSFTYSSSDTSVATIDSSTGVITLLAAGYVNFTATQAATDLYNSASKTSNTMTVHRQILPLVRSSPTTEVINKTYGDSYFNVVASNASNGGTITYETDNPSVAGIVGLATAGIISVVTVGTATITARRGDTPQYSSHPVSWTVEVGRTTTTLTGLSDLSYNVTAAPFSVSASSASDGAVSYSLQDPSSNVLTIHPTTGLVTLRAPGSAVIVASQAQGTLYLSPASITATITVSSAGNALQGSTITNTSSFESVNLSGASLAGVSITDTTFASANLSGSNMTNAVITNANFGNADLSGATLTGAIITGATFTAVSLTNADLSGAIVSNTVFTGADLSGARLTRVDASGSSFANASLSNVDFTGANITNTNFTNTNIKGANITDVSFSDVQKLQLLKNSENREIPQVILTEVPGTTVLTVVSETSPLRSVANLNLASSTLKVIIPQTSPTPTTVIQNIEIDVNSGSTRFYLPINESDYFQIQDIKYYASAGVVRNYATNAVVEVIYYSGTPIWLFAGSIVGLILQANTLNSASFVVPRIVTLGTLTPFMPTTLPTSNSNAPIVYSSSHPAIASIDASSGLITVAGTHTGEVVFTATQAQNVTHEPGVCVSNRMFVSNILNFSLIGLNQAFDLSTMATLDASSVNLDATDATAIFYVRLSDMLNVFKYQSDAFDVNNIGAQDIKYFVFHRNWPSELRINPSHAMMDQTDSLNMLGSGFSADKSLTKHDFIRHIALSLFNTIHGVDLFSNEEDLLENSVYLGETVRHNIDGILSNISTTSASEAMAYDASGNKYLTNDASGNTNLCRELMRQVAASSPLRFYNNGGNNPGIKTVPFHENDTIQFKLVMQAAIQQNLLTGVSEIPTRSYTIKLILKNTVSPFANTNTTVGDSEMYPNAFPYSTSVATYAPTADSSGVYNIYSPPAPIPFSRYGYNGWYYTNSTAWVNVEPAVRNHVKWLVGANTGSSKVGDLQYIRFNLKIHNKSALPYLMIYTDAGSSRKYPVAGGSASLTNGELYSFYMNFNSYAREPAVIGHTNAALAYTIGSGAFANTEGILNIALETDSNAAAGNVEFTLMSIVIGELSTATGATTEREYGFQAAVLDSYP